VIKIIPKTNKRYLRGRKPQREAKKNRYYSFDIECAGLNPINPLLICIVPFEKYSNKVETEYIFTGKKCKKHFKNWLDNLPKCYNHIIYSHNGSRFDIYSVFDKWEILASKKFERNGSIFYIQYKPNIEFRDSRHILQAPLSAFGSKGITPEKFIDEDHPDYGSYLAINENDIKYCLQDCIILKNALNEILLLYRKWSKHENASLPLTTASMAHRVFSSRFWPSEWQYIVDEGKNKGQLMLQTYINEEAEKIARKAYYGGRVQVIGEAGKEYENVMSLDRNSMYPAVMLNSYPDPTKTQRVSNLSLIRKNKLPYWGEFELDGSNASSHFLPSLNILEKRDYTQTYFKGFLCSPEVEHALKNGWKLINYNDVWCSTEVLKPFKEYVNYFYDLRLKMKADNDHRESLIKLMLNALYGVFGTKGINDRIENADEIKKALIKNPNNYDVHFWNVSESNYYLIAKNERPPPQHTCFIWCAFVTSYARVDLDTAINDINKWGKNVVYCDTDSVHFAGFDGSFKNCPLDIGKKLGQWDIERIKHSNLIYDFATSAAYYEPKVYTWFLNETPIKIKHKGCSESTGNPRKPQTNRSVILYRAALRRKLTAGTMIKTIKRSKKWCK